MPDGKTISGTFLFDPTDKIYLEHFPGNPVVPGSLIIDAFVKALINNNIIILNDYTLNNFRFRKFISPGEYTFHITEAASFFSCKLLNGEKTVVTGEILI